MACLKDMKFYCIDISNRNKLCVHSGEDWEWSLNLYKTNLIFTTLEEAEAKLKEMKGE